MKLNLIYILNFHKNLSFLHIQYHNLYFNNIRPIFNSLKFLKYFKFILNIFIPSFFILLLSIYIKFIPGIFNDNKLHKYFKPLHNIFIPFLSKLLTK